MKTLSKKLSREEMKKIVAGTNTTWWDCGVGVGKSCSVTDPSTICGETCLPTGVQCTLSFGCP